MERLRTTIRTGALALWLAFGLGGTVVASPASPAAAPRSESEPPAQPVEMVLHSFDQGQTIDRAAAGRWMVTGSVNLTRVWRDGALRRVLPGGSPILLDEGETVVTVGDGTEETKGIRLWSSATGELLDELAPEVWFSGVAATADGSKVFGQVFFSDEVRILEREPRGQSAESRARRLDSVEGRAPIVLDEADLLMSRGKGGLRLSSLSGGDEKCFLSTPRSFGQSFATTPSGHRLAAPLDGGRVGIWETETCRLLSTLDGFTKDLRRLVLDPKGERLATSEAGDFPLRVWDLETGQELHRWSKSPLLMALAFSPSGDRLVFADPAIGTTIVDAETGEPRLPVEALPAMSEARFTEDGRQIWGIVRSQPTVLDAAAGHGVLWPNAGRNQIADLRWGAEGRLLAVQQGREVRVFDLEAGFSTRLVGRSFAFGPGHRLVVGPVEGRVQIWDLEQRLLRQELVRDAPIERFAVDPGSGKIATFDEKGGLELWSASGKRIRHLTVLEEGLDSLAFVAGGQRLVGRGKKGRLRAWSTGTGDLLGLLEPDSPGKARPGFEVSASRRLAAGIDRGGALVVWGLDPLRQRFSVPSMQGHVADLAFVDGDSALAAAMPGKPDLRLYDLGTQQMSTLPGHPGGTEGLAADATGRWLAVAGRDRSVRIWDVEGGRLLLQGAVHPSVPRALAWSPDGELLASGDRDGEVRLWQRQPSRLLGRLLLPQRGRWVFVAADGRWDAGRRGPTTGVTAWQGAERLDWAGLEAGRTSGLLPAVLGLDQEPEASEGAQPRAESR